MPASRLTSQLDTVLAQVEALRAIARNPDRSTMDYLRACGPVERMCYEFIEKHGPAIRAAVGGEAVVGANGFASACTTEAAQRLPPGYYALYASPPATVDVGATTDAFHDGVILALQVLNASGDCGNADYVELVNCCGLLQLVKRAMAEDMMELSGLATYLQDSRVIRGAQSNPELAALIGEEA